jgi:fibronectin type 3 domain-containing protein
MSQQHCITPIDTFAPAAPKGLALVPVGGQISLIWDGNTEKDLAGYLVLRGEAPNGPLQPITPEPIRETSFRDATVKPGTRYIYAIVAVDTATPGNRSPESQRVEETAR